jgi:hypothetical protein
MSVNKKLAGLETNKNGITYVSGKLLEDGDVFEGFLVGKHMDRDEPSKISTLVFQDEGGELFGLNSNFVFIDGINGANAGKYDQIRATYGGKVKTAGLKNAAHQWVVEKGSTRITEADSAYGTGGGPKTVAGL